MKGLGVKRKGLCSCGSDDMYGELDEEVGKRKGCGRKVEEEKKVEAVRNKEF